jgi:hypothetical protein
MTPEAERPFIITAAPRPQDLRPFTELRQRFFPPERNYLAAHLTLFHHVPPAYGDTFMERARRLLDGRHCFEAEVGPPVSLGRGVAYPVLADELFAVRRQLRGLLEGKLSRQDAAPWKRPHLTAQNKVGKEEARRLLRHLTRRFEPCTLTIVGVDRYRYDGGPWTFVDRIALHPRSDAQTLSFPPG